jgi:mono/diheme cytochrome c family protein
MGILVMLVVVVMIGCTRTSLTARPASGPGTPVPKDVAVVAKAAIPAHRLTQGEVRYIRHCAGCHGADARGGGAIGKALEVQPRNLRSADLLRNSDDELVVRILHGKSLPVLVNPKALPASEEEVSAILAHMRRLPTLSWGQVEAGESVYDSLCLTCHGIYGRGDGSLVSTLPAPPRDLSTPPYQQQVSDDDLLKLISEGKGAMPGSGDVLSLDDRKAVVTFVRMLSPGYELYDRYCVGCHGTRGKAPDPALLDVLGFPSSQKMPPAFDRAYFQSHTDEQLRPKITHMVKLNRVAMPHFAGELTAEQVREVVRYLRTLSPES